MCFPQSLELVRLNLQQDLIQHLIEGMAEAIEGTTDDISIMDFTALAYNHNYKIDLNSLFSGLNFFKSGSSLAYTYSGAFIQFLIEKFGIEKVKNFYAGRRF